MRSVAIALLLVAAPVGAFELPPLPPIPQESRIEITHENRLPEKFVIAGIRVLVDGRTVLPKAPVPEKSGPLAPVTIPPGAHKVVIEDEIHGHKTSWLDGDLDDVKLFFTASCKVDAKANEPIRLLVRVVDRGMTEEFETRPQMSCEIVPAK